jgi:hypothetical protein
MFDSVVGVYFSMVSPSRNRHVVTDHLLEMARWVAETRPKTVLGNTLAFTRMLNQEFIPIGKRSFALQRWAAMVVAASLSKVMDEPATRQEAAVYFDIVHELIWELVALASTEVTAHGAGGNEDLLGRCVAQSGLPAVSFAHTLFSQNCEEDFAVLVSQDAAIAADYLPDAAAGAQLPVSWVENLDTAWVASSKQLMLRGVAFSDHMHSLVLALTLLTRICPNMKERGLICLANVARTLMKTSHAGGCLVATVNVCMKFLRYPPMDGIQTMPLYALLGIHAHCFPRAMERVDGNRTPDPDIAAE